MTWFSCFDPGVVAQDSEHGRPARYPHALFHHGVVLLRRLQTREVTSEPAPGETAGGTRTQHKGERVCRVQELHWWSNICCSEWELCYVTVGLMCFRHRGTILERTPTSCCQTLVNSFTPTGQATEERSPLPPTTLEGHVIPTTCLYKFFCHPPQLP